MFEDYKPTEEDISKAEASMTDEQRAASHIREEGFALGEQSALAHMNKEIIPDPEIFGTSVEIIQLHNTRITSSFQKILRDNNVKTISELIAHSPSELLRFSSFGRGKLNDLEEWLAERGLKLKEEVPWDGGFH